MLESALDSNTAVQVAGWVGAISVALVGALMLEIVVLRSLHLRRKQRVHRLHEKWQPILVESLDRVPADLPQPPARKDAFEFILLWNYMRESLRDEAGENLSELAHALGMHHLAAKMLDSRNLRNKLLGIQTLGWLREKSAEGILTALADTADPVVSLCAARALMRIDVEESLPIVLPRIARRGDWSFAVVGAILKEAGADVISEPLARAVLLIPEAQAPRMLRLLELAHPQTVAPAVRILLDKDANLEIATSCLRLLQDPEDLPTVRRLLTDERWQVRLQAAVCLGRIGTPEDVALLTHACGDLEWWVRYRAAQALANLPFVEPEQLAEIAATHSNEFAGDIIRQVIAERQVSGDA